MNTETKTRRKMSLNLKEGQKKIVMPFFTYTIHES